MTSITVKGMTCGHCVSSVEKAVGEIPGVEKIKVDLKTSKAAFEAPGVDLEEIKKAIVRIGFEPGEVVE